MILVTAILEVWTSDEGRSHFIVLPDDQAGEVKVHAMETPRGFGSVKVEAALGDVTWRTSLFPRRTGGYFLPVKIDVCRRAAISAGDEVSVALELL